MKPFEVPPLDLRRFHWDVARGVLTAEASDFAGSFYLHRLYNDACDLAIAIRSHVTDKVERFGLANTAYNDNGGETLYWRFLPLDPASKVKEVIVYND